MRRGNDIKCYMKPGSDVSDIKRHSVIRPDSDVIDIESDSDIRLGIDVLAMLVILDKQAIEK